MYVSELIIENYRCFERLRVSFVEGLNVVIGANNEENGLI